MIAPTRDAPLAGIRAVTYDLWRTLVRDRDSRHTDEVRRTRLRSLLSVDDDDVRRMLDDMRAYRHAEWSEKRAPTVATMVQHALGERGGPPAAELVSGIVECLGESARAAGVEALPGAIETVSTLAGAGVPVGVICDVGITSGTVTRQRLADHLTAVVLSDEIGVPKPYRAPFGAVLAALGVPATDCLHVGDLRRKDVAGAQGSGLRSVRYRGDHDDSEEGPEAEFVIDRHQDLLRLLRLSA